MAVVHGHDWEIRIEYPAAGLPPHWLAPVMPVGPMVISLTVHNVDLETARELMAVRTDVDVLIHSTWTGGGAVGRVRAQLTRGQLEDIRLGAHPLEVLLGNAWPEGYRLVLVPDPLLTG